MKITNWLKAGRSSKANFKVISNMNFSPKGSIGDCFWEDHVQIKFYSPEKERFIRVTMTLEEAKYFQEKLNDGMKKFKK